MAIEAIDQANPSPLPSQLPVETLVLVQDTHPEPLDLKTHENVRAFRKAADYIAAGEHDQKLAGAYRD
jgi:hypothetical protein